MLLQLRASLTDEATKTFLGKQAGKSDYGVLLTGEATAFKPNGERLITLLPQSIPEDIATRAYPFLHWLRKSKTNNRGKYSGSERVPRVKKDGTVNLRTTEATEVRSAIVGYFDKMGGRFPFCRATAFVTEKPEEWGECLPLIQHVAGLFKQHVPDRYGKQLEAAKRTHPAYVLHGTPFTTLTVNNCVAGGYHTDAGDYGPGFGVICVFRRGGYKGCELIFPKYKVAVDLQDRDVILFDPHEVHGNVPFFDQQGEEGVDWERISIVFYFREKMLDCLSPAEELARAKARGKFTEEAASKGE